jgi:hypothetical protein
MRAVRTRLLLLSVVGAAAMGSDGCDSSPSRRDASTTSPTSAAAIHPGDFSARVDNPYFPLRPGTTFRYRGVKDDKPSTEIFTVTRATKRIMGVPCVVVHDDLFLSGKLGEQTVDWYTQDTRGNVWYFGEATRELDVKGRTTSTEGSWQAGVGAARPGIYMPASPRVGDSFQQEFFKGQAEDHFKVVDLRASVKVPYRSYTKAALRTEEWTPLEPDVLDNKYYVRGIGQVSETTVRGPRELNELVSITRG